MFSKLFKKQKQEKNLKENKETFSIAKMEEDGKVFLLRFKEHQDKFAESGKYPYQIGVATPVHSGQNGFPSKEENEQLLNMEEIFLHEFKKNDVAIFVGAIIGGGMKEFVFYTGKPKEAAAIFEKLKSEIKHHALQYIIQEDPEWKIYKMYGPRLKN